KKGKKEQRDEKSLSTSLNSFLSFLSFSVLSVFSVVDLVPQYATLSRGCLLSKTLRRISSMACVRESTERPTPLLSATARASSRSICSSRERSSASISSWGASGPSALALRAARISVKRSTLPVSVAPSPRPSPPAGGEGRVRGEVRGSLSAARRIWFHSGF